MLKTIIIKTCLSEAKWPSFMPSSLTESRCAGHVGSVSQGPHRALYPALLAPGDEVFEPFSSLAPSSPVLSCPWGGQRWLSRSDCPQNHPLFLLDVAARS